MSASSNCGLWAARGEIWVGRAGTLSGPGSAAALCATMTAGCLRFLLHSLVLHINAAKAYKPMMVVDTYSV